MNEAFVNSGSYGLPSYDAGAALEFAKGDWTVNAVGMNIGENDDGNSCDFWGAEVGYHPETSMGPGNYRLIVAGSSSAFLDPTGTTKEKWLAYGLSFDQAFGDVLGGFLRFGWQTDDRAVDEKAVLNHYADMAQDKYQDALTTGRTLQGAVDELIAVPTDENLNAARDAWRAARVPYQQTAIP